MFGHRQLDPASGQLPKIGVCVWTVRVLESSHQGRTYDRREWVPGVRETIDFMSRLIRCNKTDPNPCAWRRSLVRIALLRCPRTHKRVPIKKCRRTPDNQRQLGRSVRVSDPFPLLAVLSKGSQDPGHPQQWSHRKWRHTCLEGRRWKLRTSIAETLIDWFGGWRRLPMEHPPMLSTYPRTSVETSPPSATRRQDNTADTDSRGSTLDDTPRP